MYWADRYFSFILKIDRSQDLAKFVQIYRMFQNVNVIQLIIIGFKVIDIQPIHELISDRFSTLVHLCLQEILMVSV